MKTLFKLNLDGTYTNIEMVECETTKQYKSRLSDWPDDYFKSFSAAKKAALDHMNFMLNEWKYAVKDMKAQIKANY